MIQKQQSDNFKEAARYLECGEDEARREKLLKKVIKGKSDKEQPSGS